MYVNRWVEVSGCSGGRDNVFFMRSIAEINRNRTCNCSFIYNSGYCGTRHCGGCLYETSNRVSPGHAILSSVAKGDLN